MQWAAADDLQSGRSPRGGTGVGLVGGEKVGVRWWGWGQSSGGGSIWAMDVPPEEKDSAEDLDPTSMPASRQLQAKLYVRTNSEMHSLPAIAWRKTRLYLSRCLDVCTFSPAV